MNFYNEIKQKLIDNEIYEKVKDYSKERNRVITYYEIGRILNEAGSVYGENIIGKYSKRLQIEVGKKYDKKTLFRMRQFYIAFEDEKVAPLARQLSWSHYIELLPLKDINKIEYYIDQCMAFNLSRNQLREKIKNNEYERLPEETKIKLVNKDESNVQDFIKNPIVIHNPNNINVIKEKTLQRLILEDIPSFLEELGSGFTFIKNEYKIKIGNRYNSIDLLLYNIDYNCYVVLELKVTELKKEYIGQIKVYMNYIDNNLKTINQDKTIGIIIVKKDNKFIMEYCSDTRILSKEYKII